MRGGEGGDVPGHRGLVGEGAIAKVGPALLGPLCRLPQLVGVTHVQRLQLHVPPAQADPGGQGAGGRVHERAYRRPRWQIDSGQLLRISFV